MTPRAASLRERVRLVGFVLLTASIAWLATEDIDDLWEWVVG